MTELIGGFMPDAEKIVAVGLLTQSDLTALGTNFKRAFPVDETPCFNNLLRAIEADGALWRARDAEADRGDRSGH